MNERPLKRIEDARTTLAEIVGEETLQGRRMQAGALLDLMDVAAGRAAFRHSGSAVVTLSFDRVDLVYPIHHQDLIRLNAEVALVGNSSMLVSVRGYRKDPRSREFLPIQRSFVTMVAVDAERRANPNIPGLSYHGPQDEELRDAALHVKSRNAPACMRRPCRVSSPSMSILAWWWRFGNAFARKSTIFHRCCTRPTVRA